jgi:alanine racemase
MIEILDEVDIRMIAIDSYPEYQIVSRHSRHHVLILGEMAHENYVSLDIHRTAVCIWNLDTLDHLIALDRPFRVHLFLDTGMHREGISSEDLEDFLGRLSGTRIILEGVCSHFADGDNIDPRDTDRQIQIFKEMHAHIERHGFAPIYRHIAASTAILKLSDPFFTAVRPGIILYGYTPLSPQDPSFDKGS